MPIKVFARIRYGFDQSSAQSLLRLSNSSFSHNASHMMSPTVLRIGWGYDGSFPTLKGLAQDACGGHCGRVRELQLHVVRSGLMRCYMLARSVRWKPLLHYYLRARFLLSEVAAKYR